METFFFRGSPRISKGLHEMPRISKQTSTHTHTHTHTYTHTHIYTHTHTHTHTHANISGHRNMNEERVCVCWQLGESDVEEKIKLNRRKVG